MARSTDVQPALTGRITLIKRYTQEARELRNKPQRYQRKFINDEAKALATFEDWWADPDVKAVWLLDIDHPERDQHRNLSTHPKGVSA